MGDYLAFIPSSSFGIYGIKLVEKNSFLRRLRKLEDSEEFYGLISDNNSALKSQCKLPDTVAFHFSRQPGFRAISRNIISKR